LRADCGSDCDQQIGEYASSAGRALRAKDYQLFDGEDFYTIFFLTLAESSRLQRRCLYIAMYTDRAKIRGRLIVHVRGLMAIMNHLESSIGITSISHKLRFYAPQFLVYTAASCSHAEVLEAASFYRRELGEIMNNTSIQTSFAHQAGFLLPAFVAICCGLLRIYLEFEVNAGSESIRDLVMSEIKEYWGYWEKIGGLRALNCCTRDWLDLELSHMWFLSSKVISCIHTGNRNNEEGFMWALSLFTSAMQFYQNLWGAYGSPPAILLMFIFSMIGIGATIVPPAHEIECNIVPRGCMLTVV